MQEQLTSANMAFALCMMLSQGAIEALAESLNAIVNADLRAAAINSAQRGTEWLLARVESGEWTQPSPIGFYFAKLWYYEKLYPMTFTVGALNRVRDIHADLV